MDTPKIQELLWFELGDHCPGRHYVLGNAHTHPGRILAWCPVKAKSFFVSKNEMSAVSDQTRYWLEGFPCGTEVRPPEGAEERAEWETQRDLFHRDGSWPRPGWNSTGLEDDARHARLRGMSFKVATKQGRGKRWKTIGSLVEDLKEAVALAREKEAWESGVFTAGPEKLAGFKYWSSHNPDLFNSTVIYLDVS